MKTHELTIRFEEHVSIETLSPADAELLLKAREATRLAYAPYSDFRVGSAAVLENGHIVVGSNQENASYPVGICAERALLASAAQLHPGQVIRTMAISYHNLKGVSNKPASPCGMCRQALAEQSFRQQSPVRLILSGMEGPIYVFSDNAHLLPFSFSGNDLG